MRRAPTHRTAVGRMRPTARAGISLLEVLVSIFVLLGGLLAVAAMIPVAGLRISRTNQADYSSACGVSGLRDVKVRRMLDSFDWFRRRTSASDFDRVATPSSPAMRYEYSYAIDPLGFGRHLGNDTDLDAMAQFPHTLAHDVNTPGYRRMRRVTLDVDPGNEMPLALADRIFTWHDDLAIPIPSDPGVRPEAIMADDGSGNDLTVQIQGKYSWLVTVTPAPDLAEPDYETPSYDAYHFVDDHRSYLVSAVVFRDRDFSPENAPLDPDKPGERMVKARLLGEGIGGGDVRLFLPDTSTSPPTYLDVKEGQWLMLCGRDEYDTGDPDNKHFRGVFRWYRVVAAGEDAVDTGSTWERYVTLAGPDWNIGDTSDSTENGWCLSDTLEVDAALFTGVIGVYTTTIELEERGSVWEQ